MIARFIALRRAIGRCGSIRACPITSCGCPRLGFMAVVLPSVAETRRPSSSALHLKVFNVAFATTVPDRRDRWQVRTTADRGKIVVAGPRGFVAGEVIIRDSPLVAYVDFQTLLDASYDCCDEDLLLLLDLHCSEEAAPGGVLAAELGAKGQRLGSTALRIPAGCPSVNEAFRILKIAEANSYDAASASILCDSTVLYPDTSRINHSCNPNAVQRASAEGNHCENVATRDISPGEEVTVSYLPELDLLQHIGHRRELLRNRWQFECHCERCSALTDPIRSFRCFGCGSKVNAAVTEVKILTPCLTCGLDWDSEGLEVALQEERALDFFFLQTSSLVEDLHDRLLRESSKHFPGSQSVAQVENLVHQITKHVSAAGSLHSTHGTIVKLARLDSHLTVAMLAHFKNTGEFNRASLMETKLQETLEGIIQAERGMQFPDGLVRDAYVNDLVELGELYARSGRAAEAAECFSSAVRGMRSGLFVIVGEEFVQISNDIDNLSAYYAKLVAGTQPDNRTPLVSGP
eukprot:TRINITY_DN62978_c0_g1_i1.p1 TRINITY_DN62978_c0_g1~~TRINITY_DN62978_c0_g1_i1.p1  ORF type:complete len:519 (+),score=38.05 TRINITY_DN62978_c0_g1_i1:62-1618(+)